MEDRAILMRIEHDREITREMDGAFLLFLRRTLLLALKEAGTLTEAQYGCAERRLKERAAMEERAPQAGR